MSLATFLTSTAAIQRQTGAPDASGGKVSAPFATVTGKGALACAVWPNAMATVLLQQQLEIRGDYVIAFSADPKASAGDRVGVGSLFYLVKGTMTYGNGAVAGIGTLYLLACDLWA